MPLPYDLTEAAIEEQFAAKGEYRRDVDDEGFRILMKPASA